MEAAGEAALRDPAGRLPAGFWAAAGVWLERPQVANKRLSGACAEPPLRLPRAGGGAGATERAWRSFCAGAGAAALGLEGPLELVLRRLLPRRPRPPPAAPAAVPELVVRGGRPAFPPLFPVASPSLASPGMAPGMAAASWVGGGELCL